MKDELLLKSFINEAINEEARKVKDALSARLALAVIPGDTKVFMLYDPEGFLALVKQQAIYWNSDNSKGKEPNPVDAIYAVVMVDKNQFPQWGAKTIAATAAKEGYGPLLYDIAMDESGGLTPDRYSVSSSAKRVWQYYSNNRSDVEKKPLDDIDNPKTKTPKDDSELHPGGQKNPLNYAYFIKKGPATARLKANHDKVKSKFRTFGGGDFLGDVAQEFFDRYYRG